ncbi:arf-GAP with coiled-coil, ANK repeat and PH domain-containing protein 3 isoform X2 [Hypomesus transpacificus]|uniref:arf-GAP with coiled-coil, ANK repeat and PH domain-containing protein 3 isoform X2 n=1 Tax=Hypomesus transpacificus TaxID=137520 RepID=UPI001F07EDC0|nr:arf-GAP with coiled-coil, ANK repeat and PH domain-containing protein 3 isoform X2 [Hypomesus transpacificus]
MTVDFEECIKDSPRFRAGIDEVETDVVEIEAKLEKLVKLCSGMIEAGRAYVGANKLFVNGIKDLSLQCKKEEMISECLEKCGESLQEIVNYHMILFDQAQRSVKQQLQTFIKEDVRKFKETRRQFERVREDLELAQVKHAQAPRTRPHEAEEASTALCSARRSFRHLGLDYVLQINVLQAKKKFEILDSMLSCMHAQYTFFQQGYNILDEIDPYMKKLATELDQLVIDSAVEKRELEHKHAIIQQRTLMQDFSYDDTKVEFNVDAPNGVVMEGYLFKRASNAFKTWNRRWFSIQNSQLVYQKKLKDSLTVVVEDLRLCSVKPCEDNERRFCFEVASPTKSCMLQAESEKLRQAWIQAVQASIASAYRNISDNCHIERLDRTASPSTCSIDSANEARERGGVRGDSLVQRVQMLPGNELCCDCSQAAPCWASINLGVLLCIECSGIHRSLGVHCSKVRSLTLDSWEPELLKLMCELGNTVINQIYEGACDELGVRKPSPASIRQEKEAWIQAKYVERRFLRKLRGTGALGEGGGKPRPWGGKKCVRRSSSARPPKTHRRHRHDLGSALPANLSAAAAAAKFRRDSLFCPDELDHLFSYFDTGSGPRSLSSDSGLGGSTDGSTDVLVFGSVVDSVTEEEQSEDSSVEGEVEVEVEGWDGEDVRERSPGSLLQRASGLRCVALMAEALALGADVSSASEDEEGRTALIQAVIGDSLVACEFLLQNGADVNQRDRRGRGPLHHATHLGHTGQVCLFLKRGASQTEVDEEGQDPLSVAVQAANADIVTLLRLARMNEEMREAEGPVALGQPGQYHSSSPTEQQYRVTARTRRVKNKDGGDRMNSNGSKRAPTTATQRLKQDYLRIKKDPVPYICAEPLPSNILEWHYVVRGPEKTPYEGGYYHGKLIFPREFPFKPPSIYMITPNGRFKCNTRLCLSITDFHPDTWNPAWSVSTILTGLLSFMVEKGPTLGSIETSDYTKRQLSAQSLAFNLKDKVFSELFPDVVDEIKQKQKLQEELSVRQQPLPLPDVVPDRDPQHAHYGLPPLNGAPAPLAHPAPGLQQANRNHGLLGGALANLFVIVGFAAFAYTVKYVLRSIAQE